MITAVEFFKAWEQELLGAVDSVAAFLEGEGYVVFGPFKRPFGPDSFMLQLQVKRRGFPKKTHVNIFWKLMPILVEGVDPAYFPLLEVLTNRGVELGYTLFGDIPMDLEDEEKIRDVITQMPDGKDLILEYLELFRRRSKGGVRGWTLED